MANVTRNLTKRIRCDVVNLPCVVDATIIETINLETGDSVESISVDSIISASDGQSIFTRALMEREFRALINRIRQSP